MKFIHLSDLHLGKRLMEFSLIEDQEYILDEIFDIIDTESPDAVILAGDIYDKPVPSAEAVCLFDDFLYRLSKRNLHVFVISGNHDSPERIAFGSRLMNASGIHMSPVWDGKLEPIPMMDDYGTVNVYMLPFIKPIHVHRYYPEAAIDSYTDALRVALCDAKLDQNTRSVLITHQFITGASRSDSEEISVGGSDNVDVSVFDGFDYVALGHIHGAQQIGRDTVRYSGTPLKYSFSEVAHEKSLTSVTLTQKGNVSVRTIPLHPRRELRELRGSFAELTRNESHIGTVTEDYLHITLTDEEDIPEAISKLRVIYPNLMKLDYDNHRTRALGTITADDDIEQLSPIELFARFYEKQNDQPMTDEQDKFLRELIEAVREGL